MLAFASGIPTTNFFGIDINPLAVELAKTTLNIAKKIAFEERKATVKALFAQVSLDVDPSLPLDNLDKNVVCADALFTEWPMADAIVGNPPFLGDRKMRAELGADYIRRLQSATGVPGVVDLCCYWFRRAQMVMAPNARAGLVGTSGIRVGKARESSLAYVVQNGGTIVSAVSSKEWRGDAALNVSIVNWVNGPLAGKPSLLVDGAVHHPAQIRAHLQLHAAVDESQALAASRTGTAMGVIFGSDAFRVEGNLLRKVAASNSARPVAAGTALLLSQLDSMPEYCIDIRGCATAAQAARKCPDGFRHLQRELLPVVTKRAEDGSSTHHYKRWLRTWWEPREPSRNFFDSVGQIDRVVACSSPQSRPIFVFLSTLFVPTNTLQLFAFDDDYTFGVIQSFLHWSWTKAKGGRLTDRIRYTSSVWKSFPWPQAPTLQNVIDVAQAAQQLRATRDRLMTEHDWSLRVLHRAAEVESPHPLKEAQAVLDGAVEAAYGKPAAQEATEFLLERNLALAEDEAAGETIQGPGLPLIDGKPLDPTDPRWFSTDCIEPPPLPTLTDAAQA